MPPTPPLFLLMNLSTLLWISSHICYGYKMNIEIHINTYSVQCACKKTWLKSNIIISIPLPLNDIYELQLIWDGINQHWFQLPDSLNPMPTFWAIIDKLHSEFCAKCRLTLSQICQNFRTFTNYRQIGRCHQPESFGPIQWISISQKYASNRGKTSPNVRFHLPDSQDLTSMTKLPSQNSWQVMLLHRGGGMINPPPPQNSHPLLPTAK